MSFFSHIVEAEWIEVVAHDEQAMHLHTAFMPMRLPTRE
jgi:hypothetical protein